MGTPLFQQTVQSPRAKSAETEPGSARTDSLCCWKSQTVNSITTPFHISTNERAPGADKSAVIYTSELLDAAFREASCRFVVSVLV